jgi:TonB family protein
MKKCDNCGEIFEKDYNFCPVDGAPIASARIGDAVPVFSVSLLEEAHLSRRLGTELTYLFEQIARAWPQFRRDPLRFTSNQLQLFRTGLKKALARPYVLRAFASAFAAVLILVAGVSLLERRKSNGTFVSEVDEQMESVLINLLPESENKTDPGIGADGEGRVGFNRGRGEGSNPSTARSQGGGGSGMHQQLPPSQGRLPAPSVVPAPISTRTYARLPQALPDAGIDLDPALWRNLNFSVYGDPRSKSTTPSNGPGEGDAVGSGKGLGIGEGEGNGVGPGRKGNIGGGDNQRGCCGEGASTGNNPGNEDPDRIYPPREVTTRARVLSKPEPQYTEQARRDSITGTVILRAVFSRTGQVTNIQVIQKLGSGLTERAMAAAKQIRFVPATRNGQPVSMYMQLEYNFNLY